MTAAQPSTAPISFLYEDADLVVVDKPAGVPVIPAPGVPPGTCLRDQVSAALGGRIWVVHRLDRDTSGVAVFARSAAAHRALSMAFEGRDVAKHYVALVAGTPSPPRGTIAIHLHEARRGKTRPARPDEPGAREAETAYEVTRAWGSGTWTVARVDAAPLTGRHHQIRVHLKAIGTPILGDRRYGPAAALDLPVPRLALHAARIDVPHPVTAKRRVVAESPWPADLATLTEWLDAHWSVATP
jgi:tRNA pseudouridine32 synthase/23S rRNA pseudouridine746 synthase